MKLARQAVVLVAAVALASASGYAALRAPAAATVGGRDISDRSLRSELDALAKNPALRSAIPTLQQAQPGTMPTELADAWLNRLIQQEVIDREFDRRRLRVSAQIRRDAEASVQQQFQGPQGVRGFPDWMRQRLVEREARYLALVDALGGGPFTDAQLREYYDRHQAQFEQACVSHILVAGRDEAVALKAELASGADFAQLARQRSKDPGSAQKGGDLGCVGQGRFVPEFDQVVFSVPVGQVSDPVQTQFGWHLILVRSRSTPPLEQVREEITIQLRQQAQDQFGPFMFRALGRARVHVNPKYGRFELSPSGTQVVPPTPPSPPDRLPLGARPPAGIPGIPGGTPSEQP